MTDLTRRTTRLRFTTASEVREAGKYRRLACEIRPTHIEIHAAGLHSCYTIPFDAIWSLGVKMAVAAKRAEKGKKKKK